MEKDIISKLKRFFLLLNRPRGKQHNKISCMVSPQALVGHDITIQYNAMIDEHSTVDSYTYIGFNTLVTKTTIGRYNSIANNVNIGHGEHPIAEISTNTLIHNFTFDQLTEKPCIITHDVWIGSGATIRRGVTIGIGAIVGANAFVNKDVPPFAIVGGSPAKIIKYRFDAAKMEKILKSKWWEHDLHDAVKIIKAL